MNSKALIQATVCMILVFATALVSAQEKLALEYRSGEGPHSSITPLPGRNLEVVNSAPVGLLLPALRSTNAIFAKWTSPRVPAGFLWLVLDRNETKEVCDRLYIDGNGNGRLDDEAEVKARSAQWEHARFPSVAVSLPENGRIVPYHLVFTYAEQGGKPRVSVRSSGWFEGTVKVDGEEKECALIDQNANGTFNDSSLDLAGCDIIQLVEPGERGLALVGRYIKVDEKLYELEVPRTGGSVTLRPAKGVKYGTVQLPRNMSEFTAGGENGMITVKLKKGAGQLPVGKYRSYGWVQQRRDSQGNEWTLTANTFGSSEVIEVVEGKGRRIEAGEPIVSRLQVFAGGAGEHVLQHGWYSRSGEFLQLKCNGDSPRPATVHVRNASDKYDRSFTFDHG